MPPISHIELRQNHSQIRVSFENEFVENRTYGGLYREQVTITSPLADWPGKGDNYTEYHFRQITYYQHKELPILIIAESINSGNGLDITILGKKEEVSSTLTSLTSTNPPTLFQINWIYDEYNSSVRLPLKTDRLPQPTFYPHLPSPLHTYYDSYLSSRSNILLLIGPPGTGKTSFIQGLIHHSGKTATICYDQNLLEKESFLAEFIESPESFLIFEDADSFLRPRKDGNTAMHKLLNLGDGLVNTLNKKIIFSTNLPNTSSIDEALTRPGRCFDIVKMGKLTRAEALAINPDYQGEGGTLAEVFSNTAKVAHSRVGF